MDLKKKIYKSSDNKVICGVCAGIADYLDMDPTIVRLITLVLVLVAGLSFWVYIIAAIIMPEKPTNNVSDDDIVDGHYRE